MRYTLLLPESFHAVLWVLVSAACSLQECCTQLCARARLDGGLWTKDQICVSD